MRIPTETATYEPNDIKAAEILRFMLVPCVYGNFRLSWHIYHDLQFDRLIILLNR